MMNQERKSEIIQKFKLHEGDNGSPEVQVALISERIGQLNSHFESHKKDHSSRQGLLKLVSQRRKHLTYLKTADRERYQKLLVALNLRK